MALIKCKNCGNFISDKAKACPKCGAENKPEAESEGNENSVSTEDLENDFQDDAQPEKTHKSLYLLLILIGVLILGGGIAYYFYAEHQAKMAEEARLEQLRLDSIEAARLDSIRQDSIERRNFTSPDLQFYELHGKVKTCVWTAESYIKAGTLNFSIDGIVEPYKGYKFTRNKSGQIIKIKYKRIYVDQDFLIFQYQWSDGKVCAENFGAWEGGGDTNYYYDDNGLLIREKGTSYAEGWEFESTSTYGDYEFDEMGNWIKRKERVTIKSWWDTEVENAEVEKRTYIETRKITYYD